MQYTLIAGFYGILITLMNAINASLTAVYGGWFSPPSFTWLVSSLCCLLPCADGAAERDVPPGTSTLAAWWAFSPLFAPT